MPSNKVLRRRQGTLNQGILYEIKICALFALKFLDQKYQVKSYQILQNVDDFGNFDDVIIKLEKNNGKSVQFCIQLKHFQLDGNERKKTLKYAHFHQNGRSKSKNKTPFNLYDYWISIRKARCRLYRKEIQDNIRYIIFTNKNKDENEERFILCQDEDINYLINYEGDAFSFQECALLIQEDSEDDSGEEITEQINKNFLNKLTILCNQPHEENLNNVIKNMLKTVCSFDSLKIDEILSKYIEYITSWVNGYCGTRCLTKTQIEFKLREFAFNSYLCHFPPAGNAYSKSTMLNWKEMIKKYRIVLIENSGTQEVYEQCKQFVFASSCVILKSYGASWSDSMTDDDLEDLYSKFENLDMERDIYELWGNEKVSEITLQKVYLYLWKNDILPLVLHVDKENDLEMLLSLSNVAPGKLMLFYSNYLTTDSKLRKKILCGKVYEILYSFSNLEQIDQEFILDQLVNLQGRYVKVKDAFALSVSPPQLLVTDIIQILLNDFQIGRIEYRLPKLFVYRRLSNIMVKPDIFADRTVYIICFESEEMFLKYKAHPSQDQLTTEKWLESMYVLKKTKLVPTSLDGAFVKKAIYCQLPLNYKLLVNIEYEREELERAVEEQKSAGVEFYICTMEEFNGQFVSSFTSGTSWKQNINVVVTEKSTFIEYLIENKVRFKNWEIYNYREVDFNYIPLMCKYVIASKDEAKTITQKNVNNNVTFDFYQLYNSQERCLKHHLEFLGSFGDSFKVASYRAEYDLDFDDIKFECDSCFHYSNLNIIAGSPGMGKSVLVNYLITIVPKEFWTVLVNFNVHSKYCMQNTLTKNNMADILKHLMEFDELSRLEQNIATTFLENKKLCLFFDGYDEIQPELEDKVCDFLKLLLKNGHTLFITTRNVKVELLESKLNSVSRNIIPFDQKDQFEYLSKYYKSKIDQKDIKIDEFVTQLLQITKTSMSAWDMEFSGIPLQTLMISEIYLQACEKFCQSDYANDVQVKVDVLYLYERFIEMKISNLQLKENIDNPSVAKYFKKAIKQSLENHKLCAIRSIFYHDLEEMKADKDFIKEVKDCEDKIGLIDKFLPDDTPVFVHRTFAEYLIALYISENFTKGFVRQLLRAIFNKPVYDIIRQIVDRLLSEEGSLHRALLNNDIKLFKALAENDPKIITSLDKGGRNILHLGMSWGARHKFIYSESLKNLCSQHVWSKFSEMLHLGHKNFRSAKSSEDFVALILELTNEKLLLDLDVILGVNPLNYGIKVMALENVDTYLRIIFQQENVNLDSVEGDLIYLWKDSCTIDVDVAVSVVGNCEQLLFICSLYDYCHITKAVVKIKPSGCNTKKIYFGGYMISLLHFAAFWKSDKMISVLLNEGDIPVDVIERRRMQSPLHWAAGCGHLSTVCLLLDNGANATLFDRIGRTPLYIASEQRLQKIVEILSVKESELGGRVTRITDLFVAAKVGDVQNVKTLLETGADANEKTGSGSLNTPLIAAAYEGHIEVVRELLNNGRADVNLGDNDNWSALTHASWKGHLEVVKLLLAMGADVNAVGVGNCTALFLAEFENHFNVVHELKEALALSPQEAIEEKKHLSAREPAPSVPRELPPVWRKMSKFIFRHSKFTK